MDWKQDLTLWSSDITGGSSTSRFKSYSGQNTKHTFQIRSSVFPTPTRPWNRRTRPIISSKCVTWRRCQLLRLYTSVTNEWVRSIDGTIMTREGRRTLKNTQSKCYSCPPQIPHIVAWNRARISSARGRWLRVLRLGTATIPTGVDQNLNIMSHNNSATYRPIAVITVRNDLSL